jgi:hypothetical protein
MKSHYFHLPYLVESFQKLVTNDQYCFTFMAGACKQRTFLPENKRK